MRLFLIPFVITALLAAPVQAGDISITKSSASAQARHLLGGKKTGSHQKPGSYGQYARGCLAGGVKLPENGPTWQAMRLSRNRNWGHPVAIDFAKDLSRKVTKFGWRGLYIGDISQPRGGPMISGHASHQLGLDMDIWMLPPRSLRLSRRQRENLSSISVRSSNQRQVNGNWTKSHMLVIKAAAQDPRVDRIFITPPAKIWMCRNAGKGKKNRAWLQKVRPYWGHHYHFHVRMKCPAGGGCQRQTPTVSQLSNGGDGCDSTLTWWVNEALRPAKADPNAPKRKKKRHPRSYTMADLPKQCTSVLRSK